MRLKFSAWACTALVIAAAGDAAAQSTAWGDNGYVSLNGIYQTTATTFTASSTMTTNRESGTVRTTNQMKSWPVYDITAGGRLKGNLGIGYGLSYVRRTETADVSADVPHPFYFGQFRPVSGQAGLLHEDLAMHLSVMWLVPVSDAFQVAVFGGPSYFITHRDMVKDVQYTDAYPFDQAQFTGVTTAREDGSHVGYNAGVDLSYFFSNHAGIGGFVRYSHAKLDIPTPGGTSVSAEAGGLQPGVGFRVRF